jgi:hypothetical protein
VKNQRFDKSLQNQTYFLRKLLGHPLSPILHSSCDIWGLFSLKKLSFVSLKKTRRNKNYSHSRKNLRKKILNLFWFGLDERFSAVQMRKIRLFKPVRLNNSKTNIIKN